MHRADLTTLERSEHIAEWVRLADKLVNWPNLGQFLKVVAETRAELAWPLARLALSAKRSVGLIESLRSLMMPKRQRARPGSTITNLFC